MLLTTVIVDYPAPLGALRLRGEPAPLTWKHDVRARALDDGGRHVFELHLPEGEVFEVKLLDARDRFSRGRNYTLFAGQTITVSPHFERDEGRILEEPLSLEVPALGKIEARVWVPAAYEERTDQRFPVIYALDGQAALSVALPGEESWKLDSAVDALAQIRAIDEPIVVAIHTHEDRLHRLTPVPDPETGQGGGAAQTLVLIAEHLVPHVDARFRTRPRGDERTILGASMGGLFAYYAGRHRGDVFGKVACLSPSFWWAGRDMVRETEKPVCPVPRARLYIDSGAPIDAFERDAKKNDGFEDMIALRDALVGHCYEAGKDIHALCFPGAQHDSASWAARLAIPLQLLLPRRD